MDDSSEIPDHVSLFPQNQMIRPVLLLQVAAVMIDS
jgi:hypothetical protein